MSQLEMSRNYPVQQRVGATVIVPTSVPYGRPSNTGGCNTCPSAQPPIPFLPPIIPPVVERRGAGISANVQSQVINTGTPHALMLGGVNFDIGHISLGGNAINLHRHGVYIVNISLTVSTPSLSAQSLGISLTGPVQGSPGFFAGGDVKPGDLNVVTGSVTIRVDSHSHHASIAFTAIDLTAGGSNVFIQSGVVSVYELI